MILISLTHKILKPNLNHCIGTFANRIFSVKNGEKVANLGKLIKYIYGRGVKIRHHKIGA